MELFVKIVNNWRSILNVILGTDNGDCLCNFHYFKFPLKLYQFIVKVYPISFYSNIYLWLRHALLRLCYWYFGVIVSFALLLDWQMYFSWKLRKLQLWWIFEQIRETILGTVKVNRNWLTSNNVSIRKNFHVSNTDAIPICWLHSKRCWFIYLNTTAQSILVAVFYSAFLH